MLGGSVSVAFIRFAISLAGVIIFFSRMSESRFSRKKTMACYGVFSVGVLVLLVLLMPLFLEKNFLESDLF